MVRSSGDHPSCLSPSAPSATPAPDAPSPLHVQRPTSYPRVSSAASSWLSPRSAFRVANSAFNRPSSLVPCLYTGRHRPSFLPLTPNVAEDRPISPHITRRQRPSSAEYHLISANITFPGIRRTPISPAPPTPSDGTVALAAPHHHRLRPVARWRPLPAIASHCHLLPADITYAHRNATASPGLFTFTPSRLPTGSRPATNHKLRHPLPAIASYCHLLPPTATNAAGRTSPRPVLSLLVPHFQLLTRASAAARLFPCSAFRVLLPALPRRRQRALVLTSPPHVLCELDGVTPESVRVGSPRWRVDARDARRYISPLVQRYSVTS